MNILVLTPDRVGSTLLQRLITIYANAVDPSTITVNLHELTNGLAIDYNPIFNIEMLGKKDKAWGYHQSLGQITNLLQNSNHSVTSRLAHYHIKNRKDPLGDQLSFYEYLNDNFFIICARRKNLLEHALSWGISVESKRLNVYSFEEKYKVFKDLQEHGVTIDENTIVKYLNQYLEYMQWVDAHFKVNAYFDYEDDLPNIENFILNLNPFKKHKAVTWLDQFSITWDDWNKMHYLLSLVPFGNEFSQEDREFMKHNIELYTSARVKIQDMQDRGLLVSGIPIKLHTLMEKSKVIQNIGYCADVYNQWISHYNPNFGITYTPDSLLQLASTESTRWNFGNIDTTAKLTYNDIPQDLLNRSDLNYDNKK